MHIATRTQVLFTTPGDLIPHDERFFKHINTPEQIIAGLYPQTAYVDTTLVSGSYPQSGSEMYRLGYELRKNLAREAVAAGWCLHPDKNAIGMLADNYSVYVSVVETTEGKYQLKLRRKHFEHTTNTLQEEAYCTAGGEPINDVPLRITYDTQYTLECENEAEAQAKLKRL